MKKLLFLVCVVAIVVSPLWAQQAPDPAKGGESETFTHAIGGAEVLRITEVPTVPEAGISRSSSPSADFEGDSGQNASATIEIVRDAQMLDAGSPVTAEVPVPWRSLPPGQSRAIHDVREVIETSDLIVFGRVAELPPETVETGVMPLSQRFDVVHLISPGDGADWVLIESPRRSASAAEMARLEPGETYVLMLRHRQHNLFSVIEHPAAVTPIDHRLVDPSGRSLSDLEERIRRVLGANRGVVQDEETWAVAPASMPITEPVEQDLKAANPVETTPESPAKDGRATVNLLYETFEGAWPGSWNVFDDNGSTGGEVYWSDSSHRSYAGSWSAWCADGGGDGQPAGGNYLDNMDTWMVYGPMDLSDAQDGTFSFRFWNQTENGYDYAGIYNYVWNNFVKPYEPFYFHYQGKPLLLFYQGKYLVQNGNFPKNDTFTIEIFGHEEYCTWVYGYAEELRVDGPYPRNRQFSVMPRYDETSIPNRTRQHCIDPRLEYLYVEQWEEALKLASRGAIDIITITSWNEFPERTAIEPHYDSTAWNKNPYYLYDLTRTYICKLKGIDPQVQENTKDDLKLLTVLGTLCIAVILGLFLGRRRLRLKRRLLRTTPHSAA